MNKMNRILLDSCEDRECESPGEPSYNPSVLDNQAARREPRPPILKTRYFFQPMDCHFSKIFSLTPSLSQREREAMKTGYR